MELISLFICFALGVFAGLFLRFSIWPKSEREQKHKITAEEIVERIE